MREKDKLIKEIIELTVSLLLMNSIQSTQEKAPKTFNPISSKVKYQLPPNFEINLRNHVNSLIGVGC